MRVGGGKLAMKPPLGAVGRIVVLALVLVAPAGGAEAVSYPAGFSGVLLASSFDFPTAFAFFPDGRIAIAEKSGVVRIVKNGALLSTPLIDISDRVNDYWDRGLIGIVVDPDFGTHPYVYLLYVYENDPDDYVGPKTSRLTRVRVSEDRADPDTEKVLLGKVGGRSCYDFPTGSDCIPSDGASHAVGGLRFAGNTIFLTVGDAADFNTVNDDALRAQDLDSLAGKLLRVTRDGRGLSSNPFWNGKADANRSKVWAYGLRNAYRFSLRPASGSPVAYLGDVGWSYREEINVAVAGSNLGWPCYEGEAQQGGYAGYQTCQALYAKRGAARARRPLFEYGGGCVTGGAFATSSTYPAPYRGAYFFGDFVQGWLRMLRVDGENRLVPESVADFAREVDGPVDVQTGPDGLIYYLAINTGELRRIEYNAHNTPPVAVANANRTAGLRPLAVRFSSVGSSDSDQDHLTFEWDYGDGQVGSGSPATHTYNPPDSGIHVYIATLTVRDGQGGVAQDSLEITVGNRRPEVKIRTPSASSRFRIGDVISFSGSARDRDEGTLPDSSLTWQILLHHCPDAECHVHPFTTVTGPSGSFTAPEHGDQIHFELVLTATDGGGLTRTVSRKIKQRPVR
jgi:glucose/arabinose dehydrogenase